MKVAWDNGVPTALIKEIASNLKLARDGRVSYEIGTQFLFDALYDKVVHSYGLDYETVHWEFIRAVLENFKKDRLSNPEDILHSFRVKCEKLLSHKKRYVLVTSISLKNAYLPKRRTIKGCTVSFSKSVPRKYRVARRKLLLKHPELNLSEQQDFLFVAISLHSPNKRTAFMNAMGALDVIRAVWQLGFRRNINFLAMRKDHEYPTDSIISIGQAHTLHCEDAKEESGGLWYEPSYNNIQPTTVEDFRLMESNSETLLSRIRRSKFQDHLYTSLADYINALDQSDQDFRFMKLWSTTEKMVKAGNSRELIRRVSFFYKNRETTEAMMESLKKARNMNAHHGLKPFNVEMKNFKMCLYINHILLFLINKGGKFKSLNHIIDFISSKTDPRCVDEQIANLKMVRKFIGTK